MIRIEHTHEEGTLISGTSKGDGTQPIFREFGVRWSRNLGAWYVPQSRDRDAKTGYRGLELLRDALQGAGFDVELSICNERRATAEVQADRLERSGARAERLDGRAERLEAQADVHSERSRAATAGIEFGQPILVGHHSERRHRNAIEKGWTQLGKAVETRRDAEATARAADSARATVAQANNPAYIGNRIADAERDLRAANRGHRLIDGGTTGPIAERVEESTERLAYWRGELERVQTELGIRVYTKADLKVGDFVKTKGSWGIVRKLNPKTVAVDCGYMPWPLKYGYHEVKDHRPAATPPELAEAQVQRGLGKTDDAAAGAAA